MLTRIFDERHAWLRMTLLAASGIGYLLLLREPAEQRNWINWAADAAALVLCLVCARWPFAGSLGQTTVLLLAMVYGAVEPTVPTVGASWALLELALGAAGWRLGVAVSILSGAYLVDEFAVLPAELLPVTYNTALVVGVPVLFGANIRTARQLASASAMRADNEKRRRHADTRAARADERTAIARELHDVVAHYLASIVLRVGVARHVLPEADPRVNTVLDDVHATGSAALTDLRQLVSVLRDPEAESYEPAVIPIEPAALPAALAAAVDRARQTGVAVSATIDPRLSTLDSVRGLAVLRLTQEALTNVARHAGPAAHARLAVTMRADGAIEWEVADDGLGLPLARRAAAGGHGIIGMRERVEVLGGQLQVGPVHDGVGWLVRTRLPSRLPAAARRDQIEPSDLIEQST